jgi:ParB family chromosome partitioning protein
MAKRPKQAARLHRLLVAQIEPDPEQPRKVFEEVALRELASSIREDGLLQPITVRPIGPDRYMLVAGERRWRAHALVPLDEIDALIIQPTGAHDIRVKQIIENDQRQDVTPLEQARSYQSLLDTTGWTVEQLAKRLGKAPWRITERTALLKLEPQYQGLLASGNLTPSQAFEMSRLTPPRTERALPGGEGRAMRDLCQSPRRIGRAGRSRGAAHPHARGPAAGVTRGAAERRGVRDAR